MKFENTRVMNMDGAIRGMRNPMNSWAKSDSHHGCVSDVTGIGCFCSDCKEVGNCRRIHPDFILGPNDIELARKLCKAGAEHRKFLRQIFVCVDITAPRYWWQEFDTYKIGTVSNSCSAMHTIGKIPFTLDMFELDDEDRDKGNKFWPYMIGVLDELSMRYLNSKQPADLQKLKRCLPESFLQKRTVTMNYENVLNMLAQRDDHRLTEWRFDFVVWASELPYIFLFYSKAYRYR